MPCPHNEITIVQRSQRQSAVAAAAYQSGEKLFCEYDQQVKHYPEKRGIVHNEILLPANAPPEYADRNTLWNAAEAVEKQWNSQLARRWVLTIPREIPPDQYAVLPQPGLGRVADGFPAQMDGHSLWAEEPADIPRLTEEVPNRSKRMKTLGNAVSPPQVFPILKYIADIETGRCPMGGEEL